jgi:hypothetical protein
LLGVVATDVEGARDALVTIGVGVEGVSVDDGASTMLAKTEDSAASASTADIDADASTAGVLTETCCVGGVGGRCSICDTTCADGGGGLVASVATCADG